MRVLTRALAVGGFALAGCGAAQSVEGEPPSLADVAAATRSQPYRFELTVESDGLREAFRATATGATDAARETASVRHVISDVGDEEMTFEVRRLGAKTYTRFDAPELGGWTEEESAGETDDLLFPFGTFSEPHRAVEALARHGRDFQTAAAEELDGVPTARYSATVPLVELFGSDLGAEERKELEAEIRKTGSETAAVELWAGADGLVRRLVFRVPVEEDGRKGRVEFAMRFFDYGKPVEIEAPPRSEIGGPLAPLGKAESRPCEGPAAPHRPDAVVGAFRRDGFEVSAACVDGETSIVAVAQDDDEDVVFCTVARDAEHLVEQELEGAVVAANVVCLAEPSRLQDRVRTLLRRL